MRIITANTVAVRGKRDGIRASPVPDAAVPLSTPVLALNETPDGK